VPARLTAAAAAAALTAGVVLFGGGAGTAPADPTGADPTGPGGGQLRSGTAPAAYVGLVARAGSMCAEMPAPVVAAQVQTESAWNPRAVSPVGAQGIAQFMPATWAAAGRDWSGNGVTDVWDPADALPSQGGFDCSIVAQLRPALAAGRVHGDLTDLALAGYNAGAGAVLAYGGVPPFPETRAYVTRIRQLALTYTAPTGPPSAPGLPGAPAGSFAAAEIAAATAQLGVPYVYGGGALDGPSGGPPAGFDCSGLVRYAVHQASSGRLTLPRTADTQARTGALVAQGRGSSINLAGLAPGDVIAFQNDPTQPGTYSHIAIYLGAGQIIAAPHTGNVVKIQPVTIPYWTSTTWSVRRYG